MELYLITDSLTYAYTNVQYITNFLLISFIKVIQILVYMGLSYILPLYFISFLIAKLSTKIMTLTSESFSHNFYNKRSTQ